MTTGNRGAEKEAPRRWIVSGGGTGGHIYPALAIAEGIKKRLGKAEILYLGAKGGMESGIATEAGYLFRGITAEGWQGRKIGSLARALMAEGKGMREAGAIIDAFSPQAFLGTGGFVCMPAALAAARRKIPIYLHEQNALPGMANRLISLWAKRIMISFEEAVERFPLPVRKKVRLTGLPVRASICGADREEALAYFQLEAGKKTVLAAGGSQGAERVNRAMLHVAKNLHGRQGVQVLFAAGRRDYPQMAEALEAAGIDYEIRAGEKSNIRMLPYIDRMDLAYAAAQIFVGRAGASTLAEVSLSRLPAILIPYPYASENHQAYNAASLADKGGAILLEDQKLTGAELLNILETLLGDGQRRAAMAECSYRASNPHALDDILDLLLVTYG